MTHTVVVMICGPHHEKFDQEGRKLCTAFHQHTRCFQRLDYARKLARYLGTSLLVCGDANLGRDVDAYLAHARIYGVSAHGCYWTGAVPQVSNTLLDIRMAVETLLLSSSPVNRFTLVTDGWHMPRAYLLALQETKRLCAEAGRPAFTVDFDYCPMSWHPPEEMMAREQEGTKAIAAGTYGREVDTYAFGKPVLEASSRIG